MQFLVPAPLMARLAEFLDDHPSPTSARLKQDVHRLVRPAEDAPPAPSQD